MKDVSKCFYCLKLKYAYTKSVRITCFGFRFEKYTSKVKKGQHETSSTLQRTFLRHYRIIYTCHNKCYFIGNTNEFIFGSSSSRLAYGFLGN